MGTTWKYCLHRQKNKKTKNSNKKKDWRRNLEEHLKPWKEHSQNDHLSICRAVESMGETVQKPKNQCCANFALSWQHTYGVCLDVFIRCTQNEFNKNGILNIFRSCPVFPLTVYKYFATNKRKTLQTFLVFVSLPHSHISICRVMWNRPKLPNEFQQGYRRYFGSQRILDAYGIFMKYSFIIIHLFGKWTLMVCQELSNKSKQHKNTKLLRSTDLQIDWL